ncbi:MAG: alpha/beta hydrolase [Clostridiaceae bacterium]|nr:alpha/beta hydrolase [Clostridiaceae bacterium]
MCNLFLDSPGGYKIPCDCRISGEESMVCIIAHGFASSKESGTAQMMLAHLNAIGIGAIAFDFPCHGQSEAPFESLTVDACLRDMACVETYIRNRLPGAEIVYFGSSFGGYCVICHLCSGKGWGNKAFLRCAAVDMDKTFGVKTDEVLYQLESQGYYEYDPGFGGKMRLSGEFFDSLALRSPFDMELPQKADIYMIHGLADTVVSPKAARDFAFAKGCHIALVPYAGHDIGTGEGIKALLRLTKWFFVKK